MDGRQRAPRCGCFEKNSLTVVLAQKKVNIATKIRYFGENLSGILAKETTQKISVEAFTSTEIFVVSQVKSTHPSLGFCCPRI